MGNRILCFILIFTGFHSARGQSWAPVSSGITGSDANTTWTLYSYDSVLYAGGYFDTAGSIAANSFAQWNDVNWDSVSSHTNGFINAMAVYNGNLYVGGAFTSMGGIAASDIAMWNGSVWSAVGAGLKGGDYGVDAMAVYNGSLYVGGSFDSSGVKAIFGIACWNDTSWSLPGAGIGIGDEDDAVFALAVYNGNLYIGGDFIIGSSSNFAMWNGTAISEVGGGVTGPVYTMAVYKGNLYVGGMLTQAGVLQARCVAIWNTSGWTFPDSGIWGENTYAIVNAMAVYNGELYMGGFFDTVNNRAINCIAKWNGVKWSSVGGGINWGGSIDAITVYNNSIYVGGGFDSAGGVYAKNIAMWSTPSSIDELGQNDKINVYPDPANNILTIEMNRMNDGIVYTIYNGLGQQMATGKLSSLTNTTVDITTFPGGIYIVDVSDGKSQYNTKFIKN